MTRPANSPSTTALLLARASSACTMAYIWIRIIEVQSRCYPLLHGNNQNPQALPVRLLIYVLEGVFQGQDAWK